MSEHKSQDAPDRPFSIVIPAHNEAEKLPALIDEIASVMAGRTFEVVVVDDGSTDGTGEILSHLADRYTWLVRVTHAEPAGQSGAVWDGVQAATHPVIATLDGDGQNAPADIVPMLAMLATDPEMGIICGQRIKRGVDGPVKFVSSRVANGIRGALFRDGVRDSGCGLKVFRQRDFLALSYFGTMHRFLPALFHSLGVGIGTYDVVPRPRGAGRSHYGTWDRMWAGLFDLIGVYWLIRRRRSLVRLRNKDVNE